MGVYPVGDGPDLADVLPVVDELVQRDEILGGRDLDREMLDDETRHGQRGQRRTPHRHGQHQHEGPAAQLEVPAARDALGQRGGTQQKEDEVPRQEEQELMGAGVLHPGEEQDAHHQLTDKLCAKNGLPGRLIPIPREITAGCGFAWKAAPEDEAVLIHALTKEGIEWASTHVLEI